MNGFNSNIFKFYIRSNFVRSYHNNIQKIIKQVDNNLEHIDNIEIKINNPKKINVNNIFNKYIYSVKICIIKDNIYLSKTIEDNDFEKVLNQTDNFINKKINI